MTLIIQNGGIVLLGVLGPFPPVLGWLWYLVASCSMLLSLFILISLNLTRIYLIRKVVFGMVYKLIYKPILSAIRVPEPRA